jgi:uncharacterized protein (TIGR02118 family)
MIKLTFVLRRLPEQSREDFQRYWREQHGPLVAKHAKAMGVKRYVQTHTTGAAMDEALQVSRGGPEPYDGVAELWWDSMDALTDAMASTAGREGARVLLEDERRFIDLPNSPLWIGEEHPVWTDPES